MMTVINVIYFVGKMVILYICCKGALWAVYNFIAKLFQRNFPLIKTVERLALCYIGMDVLPFGWEKLTEAITKMDDAFTGIEYLILGAWIVCIIVAMYVIVKEIKDVFGFKRNEWSWEEPEFTLFGNVAWIGNGKLLVWVLLLPIKLFMGVIKLLFSGAYYEGRDDDPYTIGSTAWYAMCDDLNNK